MIPSDISYSPEQVTANLTRLARALDGLPEASTIRDRQGGATGLSTGYGSALTSAGSAFSRTLNALQTIIAEHSSALNDAFEALAAADELSESDAQALSRFVDDSVRATVTAPSPGTSTSRTSTGAV